MSHTAWWLDHYQGLHQYLRSKFHCVLHEEALIIFDLRQSAGEPADPGPSNPELDISEPSLAGAIRPAGPRNALRLKKSDLLKAITKIRPYTVVSDDGRKWLVDHEYGVPELYGYMLPSTLAVEVAWDVAAEGPTALISTGCTSGMDSVGHGAALIENGTADVVLAGATDAPVSRSRATMLTSYEGV